MSRTSFQKSCALVSGAFILSIGIVCFITQYPCHDFALGVRVCFGIGPFINVSNPFAFSVCDMFHVIRSCCFPSNRHRSKCQDNSTEIALFGKFVLRCTQTRKRFFDNSWFFHLDAKLVQVLVAY